MGFKNQEVYLTIPRRQGLLKLRALIIELQILIKKRSIVFLQRTLRFWDIN